MKSLLLVPVVITAISLVNTANAATNGTVNFSGKLNDQTCQVVLNNDPSASGTVKLQPVSKAKLASSNSTAGDTNFTLNVIGCKASTTAYGVTAYFPDNLSCINKSNNTLINKATGTSAASGVSLRLLKYTSGSTLTVVRLGEGPVTYRDYTTVSTNKTSANMKYIVQYINTGGAGTVKSGQVTGIAVYELMYQ